MRVERATFKVILLIVIEIYYYLIVRFIQEAVCRQTHYWKLQQEMKMSEEQEYCHWKLLLP